MGTNAIGARRKRTPSIKHAEQEYAKAFADLEGAETDLTRAFNRWQKLRKRVKYYGKILDADLARQAKEAEEASTRK